MMHHRTRNVGRFATQKVLVIAAASATFGLASSMALAVDVPQASADPTLRNLTLPGLTTSWHGLRFNDAAAVNSAGGRANGDVAQVYTGGGGNGLFSNGANWSAGVPAAGDSLAFNTTPAGNYAVTNDLAGTVFGPLTVTRALATETVTLNGGFSGASAQARQGRLVINGGTVAVTADGSLGTVTADYSLGAGLGAGGTADGSLVIQGGAQVTYNDLMSGVGGIGRVDISGAGTTLTPTAGLTSVFRGGGADQSIINITNGASVVTNRYFSNNIETLTIASGGSLTAENYNAGANGGQIDIGRFVPTAGAAAPNAVMNVNAGGTATTTFLDIAGINAGQRGTVNVNGGVINAALVSLGDPITGDGDVNNPATYVDGTMNVTNGGVVNTDDLVAATGNASRAAITVSGANSKILGTNVLLTGGSTGDFGTGNALININSGGVIRSGQAQFGGIAATSAAPGYTGTTLNVDGVGSVFALDGIPAVAPDTAFGGNLFMSNAAAVKSTINVTNGGAVDLLSTSLDPNQNGALIMGQAADTVSTITVDGPDSIFNAGTFVQVIQTGTRQNFTNAKATFNIINGADFIVTNDGSASAGNLQLGATPSGGTAAIVMNIGGGTGARDDESIVDAGGTTFLGGNGAIATPTLGVPTTVNVNNGTFTTGAILLYQNSSINLKAGAVIAGFMSARGGNIVLDPTQPAGTGVLLADEFEAAGGGSIDIGRSGGVSILIDDPTVADEDLSEIKSLIIAGLNGGPDSIKSSALAADSRLAIGYALRNTGGIPSFLGVTFDAADRAVLFRVTLKGDATLDGSVNFADLVLLAQNYNQSGREWFQGDFSYDGNVNFADLVLLAQNYNQTAPGGLTLEQLGGAEFANDWARAQAFVPEPASVGVLMAAGALLARRRRA